VLAKLYRITSAVSTDGADKLKGGYDRGGVDNSRKLEGTNAQLMALTWSGLYKEAGEVTDPWLRRVLQGIAGNIIEVLSSGGVDSRSVWEAAVLQVLV
jgi:hypothetical protein